MARETVPAKAARLLAAGAVAIVRAGPDGVLALVRGDHDFYWVSWDRERPRWTCSCPAIERCSHGYAVAKVTSVDGLQLPIPLPVPA